MANTCKYIAPNGKPSKLYDSLITKYGSEIALLTWLDHSVNFPSKRNDLPLDSNGEPTLKAIEDNNLIRTVSFTGKEQKLQYHTQQANKLKSKFAASGIEIDVEIDPTLKESGVFIVKDKKPTVKLNPNLIKDDTVFHEFGHIYVDLLGVDNPLVAAGISQLRNTELWNKVATLYPELSDRALGKEVLTIAIGEEAVKLKGIDQSSWKFWLNRFFRKVAELLGVEIFAAKTLAAQLITGNLQTKLNGKFELHAQYQKDLNLVNNKFINKVQLAEKALGEIKKKIATFYKNIKAEDREKDTNYLALKELETALIDNAEGETEAGLVAFIAQALIQTGKLEQRIDRLTNPTVDDIASGKDKITAMDLRKLMKYNSTFSLASDIIDLTNVDSELKQYLIDKNVYKDLINVQERHNKVKNNAVRLAITLMSQKLSDRGNNKITGMRRIELQKEYNRIHFEERKLARKKDRAKFSDAETSKYKAERDRWVNSKLKEEKTQLAEKELERYKYLLQQSNQDIGWLDRMFVDGDAINDEIIQVIMELLDEADFKTMTETNKEYTKLNRLFEKYDKKYNTGNQEKKYDVLLEDEVKLVDGKLVKTGKKSKYLVSEYYSEFNKARSKVWDAYNEAINKFGPLSAEAELAFEEAKNWSRNNEVTMPDGKVLPIGKWRNPQYKALQNDGDVAKEMYDYLLDRIKKDDKNVPYWARLTYETNGHKWYRLPAVKKKGLERIYENGLINTIKDNVKNAVSSNKEDSTEFGGDSVAESVSGTVQRTLSVLTDEEGNERHDIPINFRYDIAQEDQSYDLPSLFLLNFSMVENYKNKQKIQADVELTRELLKERKVVKQNSGLFKGAVTKIDKLLDTGLTNEKPIVTEGIDSNSYKALESIIEDRLYGISTRSSVSATKVSNLLASYTGNVLLVGNYLSSGANLAAGSAFNWMGRLGGEYYNATDITQATIKYNADILGIVGDFGKIRYSSKTNLLMEKFNALSDWRAVSKRFADDTRFKQLMKTSTLHSMNAVAEHSIQNVLMYAVLNNTKVVNSEGKYLTKDGTTTKLEEAMTLDEAYTVVNGELVLDSRVSATTKFPNQEIDNMEFAMSRMIRDLNAYLQGQYSEQKRSEIQRYWYGKLIMLLRKWLPRGMKYRWSGISTAGIVEDQLTADDVFYSRALSGTVEGYYTTAIRFMYGMYLDLKALRKQLIMEESRRNMKVLTKERWRGLTDQEQGNIQKTIREAVTMILLISVANLLKELGDDDKEKETAYYLAAFYAIRLQKEMLTYVNPAEFTKTLRSPSAALIMIDRVLHASNQLITAPTERYATGRRKGELKIAKDLEDLFPIFKHIDRDVEEALSFMMSRRVR